MKLQFETTTGAVATALGVLAGMVALALTLKPEKPSPPPLQSAPTASPSPAMPPAVPEKLSFSDEFDGIRLDQSKWLDSYPDGVRTHSNNEQQYYATDGYKLQGGKLVFIAQRRTRGKMPYTSGMVSSYGKFAQKYGRFEICARFPKGKGLWPAFWLLPASKAWPPEIDVLEILGHDLTCVYFTNHWRATTAGTINVQGQLRGIDFSAGFHTFTLDWKPDVLVWSVDGVERYRTREHVPQEPMYVLANLAVGGNWPGFPDASTPFPAQMEIDYIRVWTL